MRCNSGFRLMTALFVFQGALAAQAVVEYGLGAARAGTTTAPIRGLAKGIGDAVGNLEKSMDKTTIVDTGAPASPARRTGSDKVTPGKSASARTAPQSVPLPSYEDPKGIETGMASAELVKRFGPPSLAVSEAGGVHTCTYRGKEGVYELDVKDGKVARITVLRVAQAAVTLPH